MVSTPDFILSDIFLSFLICSRRAAVKELLARNAEFNDLEREEFLVDQLQIPAEWISEAKVTVCTHEKRELLVTHAHFKPAGDIGSIQSCII